MVRQTASLALAAALATLAACGSPEKATERDDAAPPEAAPAVQTPVMPVDAPPQEEAEGEHLGTADMTCRDTIGEAASGRLVERCIAVSPATRPPCNADNACALIQDEIDRACAMYGPGEAKPAECAA